LTETSGLSDVPELPVLLRTATRLTESYPGFLGDGAAARLAAPENELLALIHDTRRPGSLASVLGALSSVAGMVRDRISTDMWRVLCDLGRLRRSQGFFAAGGDSHPPNGGRRTLSAELDL